MMIRKPVATAAVLAALALPLAGCGHEDTGPTEAEQATATAIALREQASREAETCVGAGTSRVMCTTHGSAIDKKYPSQCTYELDTPRDESQVRACATGVREWQQQGRTIPLATSTAPAQQPQASSTDGDLGSVTPSTVVLIGGLALVVGAGAAVGGRALLRRIPTPAHGRYRVPMQQQQQSYTDREPQTRPEPTPENPWA